MVGHSYLIRMAWVIAAAWGLSASWAAGATEIVVEPEPRQQMTYGMDFERLWHFGRVDLDQLARLSVGECRVDYVRIAITGGAELEEGEIDWSAYDRQLEIMRAIQRVRPDIQWFASPRPIHNEQPGAPFTPFPLWISVWENPFREDPETPRRFLRFEAEKAADFYVRYLRFMEEQGFSMTYLDAKNEASLHLRPGDMAAMIDRMREQLGEDMPLVVAPSSHNRQVGREWIEEAKEIDRTDWWDVTAVHNTARYRGTFEEFMEVAGPLDRPVWNTELHGFQGPDPKAAANSIHLWEHIRAGWGGINDWLSLGSRGKEHKMMRNVDGEVVTMRTYYIFKHLVNHTVGGHYLPSNVPGDLTSTAAFIKDDVLTVWVLNAGDEAVNDVRIAVRDVDGLQPVEVKWWGPDNLREGTSAPLGASETGAVRHEIEGQTLYAFTFRAPEGL